MSPLLSSHLEGGAGLTGVSLPAGTTVTFDPGTTGESKDQLTVSQATMTMVDFAGSFAALGSDGRPATFTAGVATEQGEIVATWKATNRNGGTISGDEIAARLYNELVAAASDLGVTLALEGSRIVVELTPATAAEGTSLGLTFGTTSTSHGLKAASGPPAPRLKPFIQ